MQDAPPHSEPQSGSKFAAAPTLGFVRLPHGEGLDLPRYETALAAGMDLRAAIAEGTDEVLHPGRRMLVPTGFIVEIPAGFEAQVRPRSGLSLKHGITCLNAPGTIDADYRGELMVILVNQGEEPFVITRGMRIAQMVVAPVVQALIEERSAAGPSARGAGGFGSTGTA